ncbi:MAG: restriction endonuclease subunit S, partial [Ruminococcaceae bacterium]|nr:restriction endonuclease subunit S [Oscillospiraceae bacterium]
MSKVKQLVPKRRFAGFTDAWEQCKLGEIYKFQYGQFNNNPSNGGQYPVYGANGVIGF